MVQKKIIENNLAFAGIKSVTIVVLTSTESDIFARIILIVFR